jgi:hypothetical protein
MVKQRVRLVAWGHGLPIALSGLIVCELRRIIAYAGAHLSELLYHGGRRDTQVISFGLLTSSGTCNGSWRPDRAFGSSSLLLSSACSTDTMICLPANLQT